MVRYGLFSTSNGFQPTKNLVIKIKSFDSLAHFALIFALNSNEFAPFVALTFTNFALKLTHFALICTHFALDSIYFALNSPNIALIFA